ncbi:DUF488 domain-containing protein [Corticibacter populi]|uniref:DUF488 domain-containing protein n=1 Tax=Corticibacter populi TaxID=1550736 RepID=A0A3M6R0R1_9BURK|nr:DUF488 domain-containing protein [Corticibacter populi]RMX08795.1 DUF488 domain-containing protein [Corticibacter populi]RZS36155.1 uncharacterized protein YeaO (DUF488 family) [Corticibacter populi]
MPIQLKRVYETAQDADGKRILVDRIWPRGLSKANAHVDLWLKEVAPSTELRKWFNHEVDKWPEFERRYRTELKGLPALEQLQALSGKGLITLLYAAKDEQHNNAVVLAKVLQGT